MSSASSARTTEPAARRHPALPTHRQLRTFLAAVETGGISAAAQRLGLTQPAASQQVRELERCLGVRLLERVGGRVVPTAAGEAVLAPARRVAAALDDVVAASAAHRSAEVGRLRFGTGATACIYRLPPVLAALRARMPGLEVRIETGNSAEMCERVEQGALDVGLVTLPAPAARRLAVVPLQDDPLCALIPAALAPAEGGVTPSVLGAMPLILYEPAGTTRKLIDDWFAAAGLAPQPRMQLDSIETIKVLVSGGLGASVMPAMALPAPVPQACIRPLDPPLVRSLALVMRPEKRRDRGLRLLEAALLAPVDP